MVARIYTFTLLAVLSLALEGTAAEVRGVVAKIDPNKNELLLEARGPGLRGTAMTFVVDKDTQILFGQQSGQLTDLAVGKRVRLLYENRENKNVAQIIHAFGLKPSQPAGATTDYTVTGTLQRVAITDREIVVIGPGAKGPETETTIAVPEGVKITRGDKTISLQDLKDGERVGVRAEKRDGKMTADAIQVLGMGENPEMLPLARLRQFLQLADQLLQMAEQRKIKNP